MRWRGAALLCVGALCVGAAVPLQATDTAGGTPAPLGHAPLEYFAAKCARCHGPFGSFYGEDFGRNRSDAALHKVVKEMAEGPAGAPLAGRELDAQVAFHRALLAKEPFVAWTGQSGGEIAGEVSPDTTVSARVKGVEVPAKVDDTRWRLTLPAGTAASDVTVVARSDATSTTLALKDAAFSHGTPRR